MANRYPPIRPRNPGLVLGIYPRPEIPTQDKFEPNIIMSPDLGDILAIRSHVIPTEKKHRTKQLCDFLSMQIWIAHRHTHNISEKW